MPDGLPTPAVGGAGAEAFPTQARVVVIGGGIVGTISMLTDADLSNAAFPFGTAREIDLGMAFVRAARTTYVGELGWEPYIPTEFATHVYDVLVGAGDAFGLRHAGYHALNSLLDAGLGFTAAWDKPGGFVGRDALLRQRDGDVRRRLAVFTLEDPGPLMYHNEPIWRDGVLVGRITSAMFCHTIGRSIGLGYVRREDGGSVDAVWLAAGRYEVEVATERFAATASFRAPYDPANRRIRS